MTVCVAPAAEPLLALLDEAAPELPLRAETPRDEHGWAWLDLRFERSPAGTARHLLRLGWRTDSQPTFRSAATNCNPETTGSRSLTQEREASGG